MLRGVLLMLWPLSALAAVDSLGSTLGATLGAITLRDWASLAVLSGFSGAVALLHRVRKSFEAVAIAAASGQPVDLEARQLIDWRLYASCHMGGALFAGLMAFFLGEAMGLNAYLEAAGIALSSWGGAKLADRWADAFGERVSNFLSSNSGAGNNNRAGG